jgi:hypothetical protein
VAKDDVLARVREDLERGHTHLALQRLSGLTSAYPDDLAIRGLRGAVNHQVGNFAEAGRWGYLTEDADPADLAAFERAFKSPWERLRALKVRGDPTPSLGPLARSRFADLLAQAEAAGPERVEWTEAGPQPTAGWLSRSIGTGCGCLALLGVLALIAFAVYGFLELFHLI